jgi:hypothetical protein
MFLFLLREKSLKWVKESCIDTNIFIMYLQTEQEVSAFSILQYKQREKSHERRVCWGGRGSICRATGLND